MTKQVTTYKATHPETGETVTVTKGGRPINWITWIDYGKGFQRCGFSSAADYKAAVKAPRSTNPYGKRFDATRAFAVEADPGREAVTAGERLMPGCTCGAARRGDFERCRCD